MVSQPKKLSIFSRQFLWIIFNTVYINSFNLKTKHPLSVIWYLPFLETELAHEGMHTSLEWQASNLYSLELGSAFFEKRTRANAAAPATRMPIAATHFVRTWYKRYKNRRSHAPRANENTSAAPKKSARRGRLYKARGNTKTRMFAIWLWPYVG